MAVEPGVAVSVPAHWLVGMAVGKILKPPGRLSIKPRFVNEEAVALVIRKVSGVNALTATCVEPNCLLIVGPCAAAAADKSRELALTGQVTELLVLFSLSIRL